MMAAFKPVNSSIPSELKTDDAMTTSPTTPRPSADPPPQPQTTMDDATTPTKATFASSALAAQKPLPTSPFPEAVQIPEPAEKKVPQRENSQVSRKSRDSDEMDMDDSDGETGAGDDGSDDESVGPDGTRTSKKKKSQRFYCTDYPPCSLSFTRSEHLARHIRKHTGERPFQCHCSRRFSRLDNLRQHAQTVHVNEEIPMDSLAATGTRFQRQMRTDRVRTPGGRARASTAGSLGAPARGHSKSLSTSSIASISSVSSSFSSRDEIRRRPPPLVMAADPRARLSFESYPSVPDSQFSYRPHSPSDFSTPTSATFSTGQSSPRWSGVASPSSSHSRSQSMYAPGSRTPGRRLSVPSGGNPFQSPHGASVGRPVFSGQGPPNASAAFSPNNGGSLLSSPTASASGWSRRDSVGSGSAADDAWRRRTWHPDTREYTAGGSRLSNVITPSQFQTAAAPLPLANPATQQTNLRLPGIESFDPLLPRRPLSPVHRIPSPMAIDSDGHHPPPPRLHVPEPADRGNLGSQWDMGLHRGLTRLEIAARSTPPRDSPSSSWASETDRAVQAQAEQVQLRLGAPTVRFSEAEAQVVHLPADHAGGRDGNPNPPPLAIHGHQHTMSAPAMNHTPREMKRQGWYHGPMAPARADEAAERRVDRMVHPNVSGFSGFPARVPQTVHEQHALVPEREASGHGGDGHGGASSGLGRLEALVAVATGEGSTATAY